MIAAFKPPKLLSFLFVFSFITAKAFAQSDTALRVNIPVIVHIVVDNKNSKCFEAGANNNKNIERSLVEAEIADLHRDFLLLNTDTSAVLNRYKPLIANPAINFYLDTTFNQQNADRGIIRITSNEKPVIASPLIEHHRYLNVYIVNIKNSYTINDHPWDSDTEDCIYLYYCWVGRGYRLLTHEAGHWLGLTHLWGTGNARGNGRSCNEGDGINDTHPQRRATDADCDHCPNDGSGNVSDQSCDDQPSNYNNYMDYSGCRKMFTRDQVQRMRNNLFNHRAQLAINTVAGGGN